MCLSTLCRVFVQRSEDPVFKPRCGIQRRWMHHEILPWDMNKCCLVIQAITGVSLFYCTSWSSLSACDWLSCQSTLLHVSTPCFMVQKYHSADSAKFKVRASLVSCSSSNYCTFCSLWKMLKGIAQDLRWKTPLYHYHCSLTSNLWHQQIMFQASLYHLLHLYLVWIFGLNNW